jgi:predicted ATPase/DNA-binding SARP family transcriptional activator
LAQLELFFLGAPRVLLNGAPVAFDTRKAIALLAYLAVTGQPQQRDTLAALLWPDADQAHARGALRRTLSVLHTTLNRTPLLVIEREQVELCLTPSGGTDPSAQTAGAQGTCDVCDFRSLARGCTNHAGKPQAHTCQSCLEQLERAAALYQDHFMAGFSLRDSAAYDDWQFFQGEDLRHTLSHMLETLAMCHSQHHAWPQAITCARRWLALDALHEPAHRRLMLLYAWSNQRAAALRQYQECKRILDAELGVPPLGETTQLYEVILNHQPPAPPERSEALPLPVTGGAVQDSSPATRLDSDPPDVILVGRSQQWNAMLAAYTTIETAPLNGRHGHLVVIEGEAGVGKTTLAQTFCTRTQRLGAAVATSVCYAGEETLAFAPVEQLLREALAVPDRAARLAAIDGVWLYAAQRLLPELRADTQQSTDGEPSGSQAHFLEGIARTLTALLQGAQPGVLLLDDLQYADGATLDLLGYIVRRLHTIPLLIIATWCSADVPPYHRLRQMAAEAVRHGAVTGLAVSPWDESDIAALIAASAPSGQVAAHFDPPQLAHRLHAETQGLPLFVVEYLDLLHSGTLDPGAQEWPAPQGVRQFLHARMAVLSETAQQILSTAAVIGRSFDLETIIPASGRSEEESIGALEELLARRLIMEQSAEQFDFVHAQLRSLVYCETSQVRRRLLHRRVAEALATGARRSGSGSASAAATLAHHFELGGVFDKAVYWALTAGEQARQVYANREAITYFEKALALGAADACSIYLHLGDLHTLQGEYSQALDAYSHAQQDCSNDPGERDADIEHRLGRLHQRLGDRTRAVRHFAQAIEHLPSAITAQRELQRSLVLADWSLAAYTMNDLDEAVRLAHAALEHTQVGSDHAVRARAYDILSLVERHQHNLPAALEHAQRSLAASRGLGDPAAETAALNSLALAYAAAGEEHKAIPLIIEALDLCTRLGDRHREAALRNNLSDLYHSCGQHEAAMQQLKLAVAIFAEVGAEAGPDNAEIWMLSEW